MSPKSERLSCGAPSFGSVLPKSETGSAYAVADVILITSGGQRAYQFGGLRGREFEQDVAAVAVKLDRAERDQRPRRGRTLAVEEDAFVDDDVRGAGVAQRRQRELRMAR